MIFWFFFIKEKEQIEDSRRSFAEGIPLGIPVVSSGHPELPSGRRTGIFQDPLT
jgi:hypothetical protein